MVMNCLTVWAPPPEIVNQLIHFLLLCYVEAPLTTTSIIILPRVLQRRWQGMSKVVREVGIYQRDVVPIVCHTNLTIPIILLLIPFHSRQMPAAHRLDSSSSTAVQRLHEAEKTHLHGMLEALDSY
jgi:hypothetical protein